MTVTMMKVKFGLVKKVLNQKKYFLKVGKSGKILYPHIDCRKRIFKNEYHLT